MSNSCLLWTNWTARIGAIASLTVPADIRVLYWLVNNIKPQAIIRGQKIYCVGGFHKKITVNNIEYRPPLTTMRGSLKSKFKWRRSDIGTKAAMATALMVKNVLRAPRKRDEFARLCMNKRFTHTYLQAVSLPATFGFLPNDYFQTLEVRVLREANTIVYNFVRFAWTCSTVWFCKLRSGYLLRRKDAQTPPETDTRLKRRPDYIYSHDATLNSSVHMTSASVAVNGLLFDHFGIEK